VLTHVVWDWNGTLFDDLHTCVAVANQLLGEFDLPGLTGVDDYHAKFRFPIIEYYADLGFDTSPAGNFELPGATWSCTGRRRSSAVSTRVRWRLSEPCTRPAYGRW